MQRISELSAYFDQATYDAHPLIHFHYGNENDMFDAHSYNKGGLVLHMLRDLVGDEAFFASLRLYLQRHAYTAVEVHDLRQAFEEITGKDLNWFFNQLYLGKGHPVLDVKHNYNESAKQLEVTIQQMQDEQGFYENFRLPLEIGLYDNAGNENIHKVVLENKQQTFVLPANSKPLAVVIDPRDVLLTVVNQEIPSTEYETRLLNVPAITHRISALRVMEEVPDHIVEKLLADSSTTMRGLGIQYLAEKQNADRLVSVAKSETNLDLKFFILQALTELSPEKARDLAVEMLKTTDKTPVIYDALIAVSNVDPDEAVVQAKKFENNPSIAIYAARAAIYAKKGSGADYNFYTDT